MPCSQCKDLPEEFHCIQKIYIEKKKIEEKYIGCGVSLAPPDKVDAIPVSVKWPIKTYFTYFPLRFTEKKTWQKTSKENQYSILKNWA